MRKSIVFIVLCGLLICAVFAGVGLGASAIDPLSIVKTLLFKIGVPVFGRPDDKIWTIIFLIRLPRVVTSVLVGAALSVSGAVMQGIFRNPLASPELLGVSAGGSLGAVITIATGLHTINIFFMPALSIIGSLVCLLVVYTLASSRGRTSLFLVVLSGLAISSFCNGLVSAILMVLKEYQMSEFIFWTLGGLDARNWEHVVMLVSVVLPGTFVFFLYSRTLNLFSLGEEGAHSLGVSVEPSKRLLLFVVAVITGVAVSVSGAIGFVGLLIPHLLRLIIGPDHRSLVPASAVGGAVFLLVCDTVGRTIAAPYEIKVGVITALIGAPYFFFLLVRFRRRMKSGFREGQDGFV